MKAISFLRSSFNFNPRSPSGERQEGSTTEQVLDEFQSTLSKRRATQSISFGLFIALISIHALQAESDTDTWLYFVHYYHSFQSTLSKRRATCYLACIKQTVQNFNPRSPSGERLVLQFLLNQFLAISIHALQAESD